MPKAATPIYLPAFRLDVQEAVAWSEDQFGAAAADRYGQLIQQALRDVLDAPTRPGAKARPDLAAHAYVYHLAFSRDRVAGRRVNRPRHLLLYRYGEAQVEFARLLHDSRDLSRHLPGKYQHSSDDVN